MQKVIYSLFTIALLSTTAFSQKTINDVNVEKRAVSSFHGIDVATGIQLILTQGSTEELAVSADKTEHRDKIVSKVENGMLKIYYETKTGAVNKTKETKNLKAYVSYKSLDKLFATTGASVKIEGVLKSISLDLKANTGALVNGKVDIENLEVSQNTGSKITLSGSAGKLEIDGSTGSKFAGLDMATSNCEIKVSTGAIISVNANKALQVKANTGGVVKYKGNASTTEIKKSTGGTVSKI
jgi:hypothetical protein